MAVVNRRGVLKVGATLGALAAAGAYGRYAFLPPSPSHSFDSVDDLARRLVTSLDPATREVACVPYDHPLRQYHNRGLGAGGVSIGRGTFDRDQRQILTDLLHAGLSAAGRERVPRQFFIRWPGVHLMKLLVCGDPATPPYQLVLTGPHLNLRLGGACREGVAFGGPMVYGDQRGNERQGLPGNVYRFQLDIATRLFGALAAPLRERALVDRSPIQTDLEPRGGRAELPGLPIRDLAVDGRGLANDLVRSVLSTYPDEDSRYAWQCLDQNGGVEAMTIRFARDSEVDGSGVYQIFRIEGPAAIIHFHGYPHVHGFVNVAMDGDRPLSLGEPLGDNPVEREGAQVAVLFEAVLRGHTRADVAYYDLDSVAGRLRAGAIRSGDIFTLEGWGNSVAVLEARGSTLTPAVRDRLRAFGDDPQPDRTYSIATTGYIADELPAAIGDARAVHHHGLLRDVAVEWIREHGFPAVG